MVSRLQRLPTRPKLAEILAATLREFGISATELGLRRRTAARMALAYLTRPEGVLRLSEFAPLLGVQNWAASDLATSAERLIEESWAFQQKIRRIQASLAKVTNSRT